MRKIMMRFKCVMRMCHAARCNGNCLYLSRHIWPKILHRMYGGLPVHITLVKYILKCFYAYFHHRVHSEIAEEMDWDNTIPWNSPPNHYRARMTTSLDPGNLFFGLVWGLGIHLLILAVKFFLRRENLLVNE